MFFLVGRSGDRGVDIICIDNNGNQTIVQCKRYINNVGSEPIQRLHSFAITRGANRKILVTTSDFTLHGQQEAQLTGTELINGIELERLIHQFLPNYFNNI